jgi:hypothetical protein
MGVLPQPGGWEVPPPAEGWGSAPTGRSLGQAHRLAEGVGLRGAACLRTAEAGERDAGDGTAYARGLAERLEEREPEVVVAEMGRSLRGGSWEEVEGCSNPEDLRFLPEDVLARLEKAGDLLEPIAKGDCQTPLPD